MFTLVLFDFTLWLVQKTRWKLLNGKKTSALQLRQKGFLLPSPSPRQLTSPKLDLSGPDLYVEKLTNQTRQDLLLPYLWNLLFAKIVGTRDIKDQWQLLLHCSTICVRKPATSPRYELHQAIDFAELFLKSLFRSQNCWLWRRQAIYCSHYMSAKPFGTYCTHSTANRTLLTLLKCLEHIILTHREA